MQWRICRSAEQSVANRPVARILVADVFSLIFHGVIWFGYPSVSDEREVKLQMIVCISGALEQRLRPIAKRRPQGSKANFGLGARKGKCGALLTSTVGNVSY